MRPSCAVALALAAAVMACAASSTGAASALAGSVVDLSPPNHGPALGWAQVSKAHGSERVHVTVALKQGCEPARLEAELARVSDPASPTYGQYWSLEQVRALVAAPDAAVDTVSAWLASAGASELTVAGTRDFVSASVPVRGIEAALLPGTAMHVWHQSTPSGRVRRVVRSGSGKAVLPTHISAVVDAIEGVYDFPGNRRTTTTEVRGAGNAASLMQHRDAQSGSAPILALGAGFDSGALVMASVMCADGTPAPEAAPGKLLCSSNPPAVTALELTLFQEGGSSNSTTTTPVSGDNCVCSAGACSCNLSQGRLLNYINTTAWVRTAFEDGSFSEYVKAPYPLVPAAWVTSDALHKFYSIPDGMSGDVPGNSQAVIEFDDQFYSVSDLATFSQLNGVPQPDVTVVGSNNSSEPGGEATLDIQLVTSTGQGIPTFFWYSKGYLLQYLASISSTSHPPLVQSISYGTPELQSVVANMLRANVEFMKAGLRGLTIISTAGDLGVSDGVNCTQFYADFPSSSPYTTSLGATSIARLGNRQVCSTTAFGQDLLCAPFAEIPCALDAGAGFTTGGMFSTFFPRPSWQTDPVHAYLDANKGLPTNLFNASGRAYNDVGAFGNNIMVVTNGKIGLSGGTSASGPIFAGLVGLLNGQLLKAGKPQLGFFNPLLYKIGASSAAAMAFNRVVAGNNQCGEQMCCPSGLPGSPLGATWSPLAGWGTPNFVGLLEAVMAGGSSSSASQ